MTFYWLGPHQCFSWNIFLLSVTCLHSIFGSSSFRPKKKFDYRTCLMVLTTRCITSQNRLCLVESFVEITTSYHREAHPPKRYLHSPWWVMASIFVQHGGMHLTIAWCYHPLLVPNVLSIASPPSVANSLYPNTFSFSIPTWAITQLLSSMCHSPHFISLEVSDNHSFQIPHLLGDVSA